MHNTLPSSNKSRSTLGFSLVELLVALVFVSLLMAGMAKVFASSISVFNTTNEAIGIQRNNRWVVEQLNDDFSQMGMVFPDRILPAHVLSGAHPHFRIDPDQSVAGVVRVSDTDPGATETETVTADQVQFFSDLPLGISGTWSADTTGADSTTGSGTAAPSSAGIAFTQGSEADLRAGDVMVILDSGETGKWEYPLVTGNPVGNPITFEKDPTAIARFTFTPTEGGVQLAHRAGVPVFFVRPNQVVRYSVQAVALDPSNSTVRIPCLVRQTASYPLAGTIDWTNVPAQIISEQVVGFRVDLSFNGGASWARTGARTWSDIQSNANTQLSASGLPGFNSITDPSHPDWFRNISCLVRLDITTRSAIRREEYNAAPGARAYRTRTHTLLISPRNFGTGK